MSDANLNNLNYYIQKLNAMAKFDLVKQKYLTLGVREDNIDFAISAVSDGSSRDIISEVLTADYRGMTEAQSKELLEDLFKANGGEFKKENQGGYLYGTLFLLVGLIGLGFLIVILISGEGNMKMLLLSIAGTLIGLPKGISLIIKAMKGKFRDGDDT